MWKSEEEKIEKAYSALTNSEYVEAFKMLSSLVAEGSDNPDVFLNMGWLYFGGFGVEKNFSVAEKLFRQAADRGAIVANYYLGILTRREGNMIGARTYFSVSALNHAPSAYWLGTMYLLGEGGEVDGLKAKKYLEIAGSGGHIFAKRDIALAEIRGTFGRRHIIKGLYGYSAALFNLVLTGWRNPNSHDIG